jgi:hypothetical protein
MAYSPEVPGDLKSPIPERQTVSPKLKCGCEPNTTRFRKPLSLDNKGEQSIKNQFTDTNSR